MVERRESPAKRLAKLEREVAGFNSVIKVGDAVAYREVMDDDHPWQIFTTQTEAQILSGHSAVVWMKGFSGCVLVSHVRRATAEEAANAAEEKRRVDALAAIKAPAERELIPEAQAERDDFEAEYGDGNCACHINAPCGSCSHPGNPRNQEEDETCWQGGAA